MGQRELIESVRAKTVRPVGAHDVKRAIEKGFVKPRARIGMSFDYGADAVDGMLRFIDSKRGWARSRLLQR